MVKAPIHNVRLWHTGMTRSPGLSGIRAPFSHNLLRSDGQGNALLHEPSITSTNNMGVPRQVCVAILSAETSRLYSVMADPYRICVTA